MLKYSVGLDVSCKSIHDCLSSIDHGQKVTVHTTHTRSRTYPKIRLFQFETNFYYKN